MCWTCDFCSDFLGFLELSFSFMIYLVYLVSWSTRMMWHDMRWCHPLSSARRLGHRRQVLQSPCSLSECRSPGWEIMGNLLKTCQAWRPWGHGGHGGQQCGNLLNQKTDSVHVWNPEKVRNCQSWTNSVSPIYNRVYTVYTSTKFYKILEIWHETMNETHVGRRKRSFQRSTAGSSETLVLLWHLRQGGADHRREFATCEDTTTLRRICEWSGVGYVHNIFTSSWNLFIL